jgi:hypothetical protein
MFQQGQSSGLKAFIAACMREAGVMALTHAGVSESSQSLIAAPTKPKTTVAEVPRPVSISAAAAVRPREESVAAVSAKPAATATSPNIVNKAEEERIRRDKLAAQLAKEKADVEAERQVLLANLSSESTSHDIQLRIADTSNKLANIPEGTRKQALEEVLSILKDHLDRRIAQEKLDAYAEKQSLLADAATIASLQIRVRIDVAEKKLANFSVHEKHRRPALEEALEALKEHLERRVAIEEEQKEILAMQCECKEQLSKNALQPQLPSGLRAQYRSNVEKYLENLRARLKDCKPVDLSSAKGRELSQIVEAVAANLNETSGFEHKVEKSMQTLTGIKAKFAAQQMSLDEAATIAASHEELTRGIEQVPEIRDSINAVLEMCRALEKKANEDAVASVESGLTLRKYAREKVLKKSAHEPVPSAVKIGPGMTLLWGSHKDGPQIRALAVGPSQVLAESGLLGGRCDVFQRDCCLYISFIFILVFSPNVKLHLNISVDDKGSSASGREIIDFVRFAIRRLRLRKASFRRLLICIIVD